MGYFKAGGRSSSDGHRHCWAAPRGALRRSLQGCTGATSTGKASLQAPPGCGALLRLSRQPLVIWLLIKGKNWKGLSSARFAQGAAGTVPTLPVAAASTCAALLLPTQGLAANLPLTCLLKSSFSRESRLLCGSFSSLSSFAGRVVGRGKHLSRFRGKGRGFLQLFAVEPLGNFFIRLQAGQTGSIPFPLLGLLGFGLLCW